MPAHRAQPGCRLDRPERVGLGHCADRVQRFGDDPVDQRAGPEAAPVEPFPERGLHGPARGKIEDHAPEHVAVARDQLARKQRDRLRAVAPTRMQQLDQLAGEGSGDPIVRPVSRVQLVASVRRVRDDGLDPADCQRLDGVPLLRRIERTGDAGDPHLPVDRLAVGQTPKPDRVAVAAVQGRDPPAGLGRAGRLHGGDRPHRLALSQRLAHHQIDMGLQESPGAEL